MRHARVPPTDEQLRAIQEYAERSLSAANVRRQAVALRTAVEAHNAAHARPADATEIRVISYVGQAVLNEGEDDEV